MDDQMGEVGDSRLRDKLDDKLWGDDNEEEDDKEVRRVSAACLDRNLVRLLMRLFSGRETGRGSG